MFRNIAAGGADCRCFEEAWADGSSGTLSVQELAADLKAGDQLLFSNGGVFTVSEDTTLGASGIKGTYQGDSALEAGLTATIQGLDFSILLRRG